MKKGKKKKVVSEELMRTKQMRKEMSFGEKIEDIWYQYKWFILLGIFCIIVAWVCISDFINRETYDYKMVFVSEERYDYQQTDYLEQCVLSFGADLDNNGKINCETTVLDYQSFNDDPASFSANSILVDTHIGQVDTFIFIMDEYSYQRYSTVKGLFTADGTAIPIDEAGVKLSQTKLAPYALSAGLADDMYIFLRYYDKSYAQAAAPSVEIYNSITKM